MANQRDGFGNSNYSILEPRSNNHISTHNLSVSSETSKESNKDIASILRLVHKIIDGNVLKEFVLDDVLKDMQEDIPPEKRNLDYLAKIRQYIDICQRYALESLFISDLYDLRVQHLSFKWRAACDELGMYYLNGKRHYWFNWFNLKHPLIQKVEAGCYYEHKLTKVQIMNPEIVFASNDPEVIYEEIIKRQIENPSVEIDWVPIDVKSLQNYIDLQNIDIAASNDTAHIKRMRVRLDYAKHVMLIATSKVCNGRLPHFINESEFGRKYYTGVNLQSAPKEVRKAALGDCYQIDIEASVFAWRRHLAETIEKEFGEAVPSSYTLEYIDGKSKWRKHMAKVTFGSDEPGYVDYIKQAMTAISFGATMTSRSWADKKGNIQFPAITEIIKSPDARERFRKDPWVKGFLNEQEELTRIFGEYLKYKDPAKYKDNDAVKSQKSGRTVRNKVLAMGYQSAEREMIDYLWKAAELSGNEPLLLVHDALYTRNKPDISLMREVALEFNPYCKLELTKIERYDVPHDANLFQLEHERHMQVELQAAEEYAKQQNLSNKTQAPVNEYIGPTTNVEYDNGEAHQLPRAYDPVLHDNDYVEPQTKRVISDEEKTEKLSSIKALGRNKNGNVVEIAKYKEELSEEEAQERANVILAKMKQK